MDDVFPWQLPSYCMTVYRFTISVIIKYYMMSANFQKAKVVART